MAENTINMADRIIDLLTRTAGPNGIPAERLAETILSVGEAFHKVDNLYGPAGAGTSTAAAPSVTPTYQAGDTGEVSHTFEIVEPETSVEAPPAEQETTASAEPVETAAADAEATEAAETSPVAEAPAPSAAAPIVAPKTARGAKAAKPAKAAASKTGGRVGRPPKAAKQAAAAVPEEKTAEPAPAPAPAPEPAAASAETGEPRRRGRPKMTDEQKAAAKAAREAAKAQASAPETVSEAAPPAAASAPKAAAKPAKQAASTNYKGARSPDDPAVPVEKSVTPNYIVCLEDGKQMKMIKRHLRSVYDMSPEEYRAKWNLPDEYPLVAPEYARIRSQIAKQSGFGASEAAA